MAVTIAQTIWREVQSKIPGLRGAVGEMMGIEAYEIEVLREQMVDFASQLGAWLEELSSSQDVGFRTFLDHDMRGVMVGAGVASVTFGWDCEISVREFVINFIGEPDTHLDQDLYDELYEEVKGFCLSEEQSAVSDSLRVKMQRMEISQRDLEFCRDDVREMVAVVDRKRRQIHDNLWHVINAVESMQFWVEGESLAVESVDLSAFLEEGRGMLERAFCVGEAWNLECDIESDLQVNSHRGTLGNLLWNMCRNAVRHGEAKTMQIKAFRSGDSVVIEVSDDGKGIDASIVERILKHKIKHKKPKNDCKQAKNQRK